MGDVEAGFVQADAIAEGTFSYENIPNPLPMEPPGAIALWEEPNRLTMWVSNQTSNSSRRTSSSRVTATTGGTVSGTPTEG
jgi:CO/xanthine dehydrogenase Mo-binding subunit